MIANAFVGVDAYIDPKQYPVCCAVFVGVDAHINPKRYPVRCAIFVGAMSTSLEWYTLSRVDKHPKI